MEYCIELAKKVPAGVYGPYVGAIALDSQGRIIGEGCKTFLPETNLLVHAERNALEQAAAVEKNPVVLVTTLEPCILNYGHQLFSPCADLLIRRGVKIVVVGRADHYHKFNGRQSTHYLRNRGIEVIDYFSLSSRINYELMDQKIRYVHEQPFQVTEKVTREVYYEDEYAEDECIYA